MINKNKIYWEKEDKIARVNNESPKKVEIQPTLNNFELNSIDWHKYNLAKTQEKRLFYQLLHELCSIIPEPLQEKGRPRAKLKDLVFSLGLKLYSNYSGRKVYSDLVHAKGAGYVSNNLHYNTLTDFLNCPVTYDLLQRLLTISALPLKHLEDSFSIDSSGFGSYQYERWIRTRFRNNKKGWRNYIKGHIFIGTRTNVIISCEATYGNQADVKQAPKLLESLKEFNVKEVSMDAGYRSQRLHQIVESLGGLPFVPFSPRTNPKVGKAPEIWIRMFRYFQTNKEDFMKHYHKRSNVETVFSMVKMRLGEFLKCKKFDTQRSELLMKFICHNICCLVQEIYDRGVHVDFKKFIDKLTDRKVEEASGLMVDRNLQERDL